MSECKTCLGCDGVAEAQTDARLALEAYMDGLPIGDDSSANRGYLIQSLHKAQELFGFLPESVQMIVAQRLKIHLSDVYGVISFYSYFTDVPKGEYRINVCTGTACFVKGADHIMDEFVRLLGVKEGETTADMRFSIGGLRCVGACSLAPVVMVNDRVYGSVTPQMVQEILNECE